MDLFRAVQAFSQVVESGGFSKAAERLGVSTTVVSRLVAELEAHLQTRLLNRTTRRLSLTESGQGFHQRAVQLLHDLREAEQEAARAAVTPQGTLRLTTAVTFGTRHVAPVIGAFMARHPGVRFDVQLSDRFVDVVEEGYDLAIRVGGTGAQNLVARKLGETRLVPCASPDYVRRHGAPAHPRDLAHHNCFTYEYAGPRNQWRFRGPDGREHAVRVAGTMHSNSGDLNAALALQGAGIALEPDFLVSEDLQAGRLVALLPQYAAMPAPIYALYPTRRHLSAKVRLFVEFLAERFAVHRDRDFPGNRELD